MKTAILGRLVRVGIVDDNELVRDTLRLILGCSPNIKVVAEAENGYEAIAMVEAFQPDVVLMDFGREKLLNAIMECSPGQSKVAGNAPH